MRRTKSYYIWLFKIRDFYSMNADHIIPLSSLTIRELFSRTLQTYGHRPSICFVGETPISYKELGEQVERVACTLLSAGLQPGDRVAIAGHNMPQWVVTYLAVTTCGLVAVPLLPDFSAEEMQNIVTHAGVRAVFVSQRLLPKLSLERIEGLKAAFVMDTFSPLLPAELPSAGPPATRYRVQESDLAALIYTSGTTGTPKGVMLTHRAIAFVVSRSRAFQAVTSEDVFLSFLPLAHTYENSLGMLLPISCGASIYYLQKPPTASTLLPALKQLRPTTMLSVPLIMEKLYKSRVTATLSRRKLLGWLYKVPLFRRLFHRAVGRRLRAAFGGRLKFFGIGGAKIDPKVERFLLEASFPYAIGYGMTEAAPLIAGAAVGKTRVESTGEALPGVSIKINEPDRNGVGEIWVKGPNLMNGYYRNSRATEQVLTSDGWLRTGDLGQIKRGYLYIKGRSKTTILGPGGENIYPEDIEQLINSYDFITESLVIEEGNSLIAKVLLNMEKAAESLEHFREAVKERQHRLKEWEAQMETWKSNYLKELNRRLNKYSQIKRIDLMDEPFERTPSQKIKRFLYTKQTDDKKKDDER